MVTDAVSGISMYPVTVFNVSTQTGTTTDQTGLYTIQANPGDIITFSYIGYQTARLKKPPSVLIATVNIRMEPVENELKGVTIHSGLTQYQRDSLERQVIYKLPLQRRPPSVFVSPVSAIAEKFSKKAKRVYEFQKTFAQGEIDKFIDTRYTTKLVTQLTGLTGDSVASFMFENPMPYDYARNATDLEMKMWIRSSYKAWMKKNMPDSIRK